MISKSLKYLMLIPLLTLLVTCRAVESEELESASLVVTNGIIVDGTGAAPIPDGLVALQGNRIVTIGRSADFEIPDGVSVIDAAGGTILPGIINAHVHGVSTAQIRRTVFLLDGVTSVCDLGIPLFQMRDYEQEKIQSGPAARGFKAGPIVTAPGGYPGPYHGFVVNYEIQGVEEAEIAVRDLHARGADYIKVALEPGFVGENLPVIDFQELRSIVASAHKHNLLVRAHVQNSDMLDVALKAGVDVIEHVPMPSYDPEELEGMFDDTGVFRIPSRLESQMLSMIDQGIVLVPTLDVFITGTQRRGDLNPDEMEVFIQAILGIVRFFHDAGGIIAAGNDYPGVNQGMPLREMDFLQAAGLSPLEVIEAATRHAAYVCGQSDNLGTLEKGKLADLIVVDGDPLDDLNAMDSVLYIVKDGELVRSPQQDNN